MNARETTLVELVDAAGEPVGVTTVKHAHDWPGVLHRAFSVVLVDERGRVLLQQRAAVKTRFAMRWANACCGHPAPGSKVAAEAARRLREELGLRDVTLTPVGVYVYRAGDPFTGRVEHEYDHVLIGRIPAATPLSPDEAEVAEVCWREVDDLRADLVDRPRRYAPWLAGVLSAWYERASAEPAGGR